ncbi:MAG: glycoside hydrolase family 130 protein [Armatimonadota bacterium]
MTCTTQPVGNLPAHPGLPVERLHEGRPIIAPTGQWWEDGVTFNTAAVYLPRSAEHDPLIAGLLGEGTLTDPRLRDGVVAAHYRARPRHDMDGRWNRSFTGLMLFTPDTADVLSRHPEPVIAPDSCPVGCDHLGVEDPRITEIDGVFYAAYCGVAHTGRWGHWKANICLARSHDLICWEKLGPVDGSLNAVNNKDAVLFPERVGGHYLMLHRPMTGHIGTWAMNLAMCESLTGDWRDCGTVLRATPEPSRRDNWVGAGSVPIPLGGGRWLVIFHTGRIQHGGRREYDLDAAVFNFADFDPAHPERIVESRVDRIMVPETQTEVDGPYPDSVANVLFTCGSYIFRDDLYILYGGGDTYVMAARVPRTALLDALDRARTQHFVTVN